MNTNSLSKIAKSSWQLPLLLLVVMFFLTPMINNPIASILVGLFYLIAFIIGFILGILACIRAKSQKNRKLFIQGLTGVFLNAIIPSMLIATAIPLMNKNKSIAIAAHLEMIQNTVSEQTPIMIDELTRLDKVEISGEKEMTYTYTLVTTLKNEVDLVEFSATMEEILYQQYMTLPQMEVFRKFDITLNYTYLDKERTPVSTITVKGSLPPN